MNHYLAGLILFWHAEKERARRWPLIWLLQVVCALALIVSTLR